jgi:hypothetical protein
MGPRCREVAHDRPERRRGPRERQVRDVEPGLHPGVEAERREPRDLRASRLSHAREDVVAAHLESDPIHLVDPTRSCFQLASYRADGVIELREGIGGEGEQITRDGHAIERTADVDAHLLPLLLDVPLTDAHLRLGGAIRRRNLAERVKRQRRGQAELYERADPRAEALRDEVAGRRGGRSPAGRRRVRNDAEPAVQRDERRACRGRLLELSAHRAEARTRGRERGVIALHEREAFAERVGVTVRSALVRACGARQREHARDGEHDTERAEPSREPPRDG